MRITIIDGREMTSRKNAHAYLACILSLPEYYGGNLDALYDCLSGISEPMHLIFFHIAEMEAALGPYGELLTRVLKHSAEKNDFLTVSFYNDAGSFE